MHTLEDSFHDEEQHYEPWGWAQSTACSAAQRASRTLGAAGIYATSTRLNWSDVAQWGRAKELLREFRREVKQCFRGVQLTPRDRVQLGNCVFGSFSLCVTRIYSKASRGSRIARSHKQTAERAFSNIAKTWWKLHPANGAVTLTQWKGGLWVWMVRRPRLPGPGAGTRHGGCTGTAGDTDSAARELAARLRRVLETR